MGKPILIGVLRTAPEDSGALDHAAATRSGLCSHLREDIGKVFTIWAVSRSLVLEGCHEFEFLQACVVEVVGDEIEMRVV